MKYDVTTLKSKDTISLKEISEELKVSIRRIYNLVKLENFPSIRIGKRRVIVYKEFFYQWLNEVQSSKGILIFDSK